MTNTIIPEDTYESLQQETLSPSDDCIALVVTATIPGLAANDGKAFTTLIEEEIETGVWRRRASGNPATVWVTYEDENEEEVTELRPGESVMRVPCTGNAIRITVEPTSGSCVLVVVGDWVAG